MLSLPTDLDPSGKLVLVALFTFAHEDGGGIYVGTNRLSELTGLPRRTVFRQLASLSAQTYLVSDGWHEMGRGRRTRLRRLNFEAIRRPTHGAMGGTLALTQSAMGDTTQGAMGDTQTNSSNLDGNQALRTWRPSGRSVDRQAIRKLLWKEGVTWLLDKRVRPADRQARGLMGELLKDASPERVLSAIQEANRIDPADYDAYLVAAVRHSGGSPSRETARQRRRRELSEMPLHADRDIDCSPESVGSPPDLKRAVANDPGSEAQRLHVF